MSKRWWITLVVSMLGTALLWLHEALTRAYPPFENSFDTGLWILASICKIVTLVCIPFVLSKALGACAGNAANARRAAIAWAVAGLILLSALSVAREPLSRLLNNDAVRFYPISTQLPTFKSHYNEDAREFHGPLAKRGHIRDGGCVCCPCGRRPWIHRLQSGEVLSLGSNWGHLVGCGGGLERVGLRIAQLGLRYFSVGDLGGTGVARPSCAFCSIRSGK